MKKILSGCITATILSFTAAAHANVTMQSYAANACASIPGQWSGSATAKHWMIGECVYKGSGVASQIDASGNFTLQFTANKDSGNFLCPGSVTESLPGKCVSGKITITTDYGKLTGSLTETSGQAKGTLHISPGVEADLSIKIQRVK